MLQRHVPELALEWATETPDALWRQIDGTLCLADISGFTALAERLAQRGRMGGEELVETLGRVFTEMLDIAHLRGGSLLKFGGDALLLFFRGDAHALQAASAAVEMRQALRKAAEIPTSVGLLRLTMSTGLHSGPVDFFLVGGSHRELVVLGPAASRVVEKENTANAREIVVSAETAARLPDGATRLRGDGELLVRWRKAPVPAPPAREWIRYEDSVARALFPAELGVHLAPGAPEPEHRVACMAFIKFSGTDALLADEGPEMLASALQTTVANVQQVLVDEGVTLLAIDLDRDGGKFFLAAGVPYAHEDDEGVMLRAMRRIADADLPLAVQIGVNRGHVFAAEIGSARRAAFSAMGDTTNTAARIASKTPAGAIYAHPAVLDECLTRFEVTQAGPLTMKGKTHPQIVYAVGDELGLRQHEGLEVDVFLGRRAELTFLRDAIRELADGHGRVISLIGESGLGKTRLLAEATADVGAATLVLARAEPYGANSSYRMFRDPIRDLLGIARSSTDEMRRALSNVVAELDPSLMPWLALIGDITHIPIEPSEDVRAIEPQFRPDRTAEVAIVLLQLVCSGPLILVVDDAHWCDEASTKLLGRLEKASAMQNLLILVARRDTDSGFRAESGASLAIEPMPDEDIRAIVDAATEAAPLLPQVAEKIVERAAGYPLFAIEIIRALREVGSLEALPESLEAALASQVDALDPQARRVVRYASVLGHSFSLTALEALLQSEGHALDADLLERLEDFLQAEAGRRLRFRNGLLRETIYQGLSYRLRKRLHRDVGIAEEARAEDPLSIADSLALHFSRGEDYARAWHYGREAGNRAKQSYANVDAARNFEMALAAARRAKDVRRSDLVDVWINLGEAWESARLHDAAFDAYRSALTLTRDDPLDRAELLYRRAWAKERAEMLSSALRDISAAVGLAQPIGTLDANQKVARLEALRAGIYYVQDRPRQAVATARRAADAARAADERESLIRALWVLELASIPLHGPGEGAYLREALDLAQQMGRLSLQAVSNMNLGALDSYAGRWNQAVEWFTEARDLFAAVGNDIDCAYCDVNIAEIRVSQLRLDEAETALSGAMRIMRAARFAEGVATIEIELARIRLEQGCLEEAVALSESAATELLALGQHHFVLQASLVKCDALVRSGSANSALAFLDDAIRAAGSDAGHLKPKTSLTRARALVALGRFQEAQRAIAVGLESAETQGLLHDQALLRLLGYDVQRRLEQQPDETDRLTAESLLDALGVVR